MKNDLVVLALPVGCFLMLLPSGPAKGVGVGLALGSAVVILVRFIRR